MILYGSEGAWSGWSHRNAVILAALQTIAWWDWSIEKIAQHLTVIVSGNDEALRRCAEVG